MQDGILLALTWLLSTFGFAAIAFSQKQHWTAWRGVQSSAAPWVLRPAGWSLLGLSLIPAIMRDGLAFGLLFWLVMLSLSAGSVVSLIAIRALAMRAAIANKAEVEIDR